jgi:purine-cytosine permease-like protein
MTTTAEPRPISEEPVFERRGIDYIPLAERRGKPSDLAWMWAGALFNIEYFVYGALLVVGFGLRFWQVTVVVLVGNLSYVLTGLGSLPGPRAGTAGFTINRAPFGPNGARLIAVCNWMTQVGYEVIGLALVVLVAEAMLSKAGIDTSTAVKVVLIVLATGVQALLPLLGHGAILRILRLLVIPFLAMFAILAALTLGKAHLGAGHDASWAVMFAALAFVLSSGGYGWPMNANDFSRYLPPDASARKIVVSVALGGFIPTTLLLLLGAAVATDFSGASSATAMTGAFAGWFAWPYLVLVLVQLFAINSLDLYTSGLTLQAIVPRIRRWQCVLLDTIVAGLLTAWTVFSTSFDTFVNDFVLFMLIWIAPWVATFLIDFALRRGRYDSGALMQTARGLYYHSGGFNWPGLIAQGAGMVAAALALNASPAWTSPISSATGGADFSVFLGAGVAGLMYYALNRRRAAREAEQSRIGDPASGFG